MKKTSLHQILGWISIFTSTIISATSLEARLFQIDTTEGFSNSIQLEPLTPIIKVEEYRYLEKRLTHQNVESSLFDIIFGRNQLNESSTAVINTRSRVNGILLPQMVGGLPALFANIEYPVQAKARGVEGNVKVEFTVTELGMVEDIEIVEGIGSGCDEEVIKALKKTRFSPAIQNGRFVKVKLSQSILFELKQLK